MKTLLLIVLCGAMLLDGCYSYSVLESGDKEQQLPPDSLSIRVTLKNGTVIESQAYRHIVVNTPSNFIYGAGTSMKRFPGKGQTYSGTSYIGSIDPSKIDSTRALKYTRSFWLKDSSCIRFNKGEYVIVTPDQGTGLWCIGGKSNSTGDSAFAGKINLSDVQTIEVVTFSVGKTIGTGALVGAAPGLLLAVLVNTGRSYSSKNQTEAAFYVLPPIGALAGCIVGAIVAVFW